MMPGRISATASGAKPNRADEDKKHRRRQQRAFVVPQYRSSPGPRSGETRPTEHLSGTGGAQAPNG